MFGADASKLRTLTRRTEFVKCLGALSLGLQAVFIPWFVIRAGMGDPETARFGAFSFSHPVVQFLFALSLFLGVVTLTMLRFSRGAKGPTNVRRHVLLLGTLFELGLAGLLGLFISDGPSPERIPWFLVSVLVVVAGLAALIWTMATEDWASSPCGPTPSS